MASTAHHFTADEVCDMVTGVGGDHELIFPGSDDDFDVGESDYECDPLDREQGKPAITETIISLYKCKIIFHKYKIIPLNIRGSPTTIIT